MSLSDRINDTNAAPWVIEEIKKLEQERDALAAHVESWRETTAQYARNEDFFRGIVRQISELFREEARTSDDEIVQDDVLALKVPELVEALAAHVEHLESLRRDVVEAIRDDSFEDLDISYYRDDMQPPTPETSLARLKAEWQAEALEELLQNTSQFREANPVRGLAGGMADELRRQAERGQRNVD